MTVTQYALACTAADIVLMIAGAAVIVATCGAISALADAIRWLKGS